MKKYEIRLISRSVQVKEVEAESLEEAKEIAFNEDWKEKEWMLDSEIEVEEVLTPYERFQEEKYGNHIPETEIDESAWDDFKGN